MEVPQTYTKRFIQASDREHIVELARHVYGGNDWIVRGFDNNMFGDPATTLVQVNTCPGEGDRIVSLEIAEAVDGGTSLWLSGMRVHPEHQGKGLAKQNRRQLLLEALQRWPSVMRVRYTTAQHIEASVRLGRSCGMQAVPVCGIELVHTVDIPILLPRIRAAVPSPPSVVEDLGEDVLSGLVDATLYPSPPEAVVLGYWKVVHIDHFKPDSTMRAFRVPEVGVAVVHRESAGTHSLHIFAAKGAAPANPALLSLMLGELEAAVAAGLETVQIFMPLELHSRFQELFLMRPEAYRPHTVMLVEGTRAEVERCIASGFE